MSPVPLELREGFCPVCLRPLTREVLERLLNESVSSAREGAPEKMPIGASTLPWELALRHLPAP